MIIFSAKCILCIFVGGEWNNVCSSPYLGSCEWIPVKENCYIIQIIYTAYFVKMLYNDHLWLKDLFFSHKVSVTYFPIALCKQNVIKMYEV